MVAAFLMLAMASHVLRAQNDSFVHQMRSRRRRLLLQELLLMSDFPSTTRTRREVFRSTKKWRSSTMHGYVYGDNADSIWRENFRVNKATFGVLVAKLKHSPAFEHVTRSHARRRRGERIRGVVPVPVEFRIATCLYVFAHGGNLKPIADVASVSKRTVRIWLNQFCDAVINELQPGYMAFEPPCTAPDCDHTSSTCKLRKINRKFGARHGIPNVAAAVDGTHVKVNFGDANYRNYKGWESINCVCFVSPFYTFIYADVGWAGRNGDTTVLRYSKYMEAITARSRRICTCSF